MSTILLSIKPEYAKKIIDGTKKYEFRKRLAKHPVTKIIIYSTFPEKKVLGEVEVTGVLTESKMLLWETTKAFSGLSLDQYQDYFGNSVEANAYILGQVIIRRLTFLLLDLGRHLNRLPTYMNHENKISDEDIRVKRIALKSNF